MQAMAANDKNQTILPEQGHATPQIRILKSIRRIIRAVDIHSRKLSSQHGITTPQLVCLLSIAEQEPSRSSDIAKAISLSSATVIGILDRLETKGLIRRERSTTDRRVVNIWSTAEGKELIRNAPSPLQDMLAESIEDLSSMEQTSIAETFERVVGLMEIQTLDAAPILELGLMENSMGDEDGIDLETS
jgi:DNA-binding MarR family transcriptional regulator